MKRLISSVFLGAVLLGSTGTLMADQRKHEWNDNENTTWHQYLKEKHRKDHEWSAASKREQRDYWKWRDAHPDAH